MNKIILSFLLATFGLSLQVSAMNFPGKGYRLGGQSSGVVTKNAKKFLCGALVLCKNMKNSRLASLVKQEAIKGLKLGGRYTVRFLACMATLAFIYKTGLFFFAARTTSSLAREILADAASGLAYGVTPQVPNIAVRLFNGIGSYIF